MAGRRSAATAAAHRWALVYGQRVGNKGMLPCTAIGTSSATSCLGTRAASSEPSPAGTPACLPVTPPLHQHLTTVAACLMCSRRLSSVAGSPKAPRPYGRTGLAAARSQPPPSAGLARGGGGVCCGGRSHRWACAASVWLILHRWYNGTVWAVGTAQLALRGFRVAAAMLPGMLAPDWFWGFEAARQEGGDDLGGSMAQSSMLPPASAAASQSSPRRQHRVLELLTPARAMTDGGVVEMYQLGGSAPPSQLL